MTTPADGTPVGVPDLLAGLALQIQYLSTSSLSAFGRKSRTHSKDQIRRIAESIRTFGFTVPVLVDEDNKVIAGNARVEAAIQLKLPQVPVVALSHLTREQKRAFVIAENQLATLSGWDKDVLSRYDPSRERIDRWTATIRPWPGHARHQRPRASRTLVHAHWRASKTGQGRASRDPSRKALLRPCPSSPRSPVATRAQA